MNANDEADLARRGVLKCMAWAGTGVLWTMSGGLAASAPLGARRAAPGGSTLTFVQISDSHIGFDKPANPDVKGTFQLALDRIAALPERPDFILHTGDVSHLSRPDEFDVADQMLKGVGLPVFFTPGEHDTLDDGGGKLFLNRYGAGTKGTGWRSFDTGGVHFIGLVNVVGLDPSGQGRLGEDQIRWLADDVADLSNSTPLVVFAHMPLFDAYAPWGWGTIDAMAALAPLRRFGSVTVLNGHIHQAITKSEGSIVFHTARSTAYPQAPPGAPGASPGPMKVPMDALRGVLGVREIRRTAGSTALALVDRTLS